MATTSRLSTCVAPGRHARVRSTSPAGKRIWPTFAPSTYTAAKEFTYAASSTIRRPVHCSGTVISRWYQAAATSAGSASLQLGWANSVWQSFCM